MAPRPRPEQVPRCARDDDSGARLRDRLKSRLLQALPSPSTTACPAAPASPPVPPATCTSAGPAPRCTAGWRRGAAVASSSCGSRTPTASAAPRARSTRSWTAMDWLGLDYDEGPVYQTARLDRYREVASGCWTPARPTTPTRAARRSTPCAKRRWRPAASRATRARPRRRAGVSRRSQPRGPPEEPARGSVVFLGRQGQGPHRVANSELDDLVLIRARTGTPPTTSRSWSTTSTWRSPTWSAATTTSTTPRARSTSTGARRAGAGVRAPADDPRRAWRQAVQAHTAPPT
jgi:hypothetical protein